MKKYFGFYLPMLILVVVGLPPSRVRLAQKPDPTPAQPSGVGATSTLMPDGRWLVIGGFGVDGPVSTAALRDASTGAVTTLPGHLTYARAWHTATLLPNGTVLIFGGVSTNNRVVTQAEIFTPSTGNFSVVAVTGVTPRSHHTATLLTDGQVLIAGGISDAGETLGDASLCDSTALNGSSLAQGLLMPRHDQTATLLPDGRVLLWGGTSVSGTTISFGEAFDPTTQRFTIDTLPYQASTAAPTMEASIPSSGSDQILVSQIVSVRFSAPILVTTSNASSITLADPAGALVASTVVPAEGGILAFLTPQSSLLPGTNYVVTLSGITDSNGNGLVQTTFSFTTGGTAPGSGVVLPTGGSGTSGSNAPDTTWQRLPPLQARPGVTALAGQSLLLNGLPLTDVLLEIEDQNIQTRTDSTGRFLLQDLSAGHHVLLVDGTKTNQRGQSFGIYEIGVDVTAGKTNVLPYTIWLTALDMVDAVTIPSPTAAETTVRSPLVPGLELHIPTGTVIDDRNGNVVRQLGITGIPVGQPPFPLPPGKVPIYFTIQPGASTIQTSNGSTGWAQLYYPNPYNSPPNTAYDFWNYDPAQKGWYVYGEGKVSADGTQIIPDKGVWITKFSGAMAILPSARPSSFPSIGCWIETIGQQIRYLLPAAPDSPGPACPAAADPVDLTSGLFIYNKMDLTIPDVLPVGLMRTYRQNDSTSRAFGIGTTDSFDMFLDGDNSTFTYFELVMPDGSPIRYVRTSAGTHWYDAVMETATAEGPFYGSVISWNGAGWNLVLKNGTTYIFPDGSAAVRAQQSALKSIVDRYGNTITLTRDSNGSLTKIATPNGRSIQMTYDGSYRVTQAQDSAGRTVSYTYDAGGRLSTVTDANSGVTTYSYDTNNNMLSITDPRSITYITNQYDSNNRVTQQTLADGSTYQFSWTLTSNTSQSHFVSAAGGYTGAGPVEDIPGWRSCSGCEEGYEPLVAQVNVTDPRGNIRQTVIGSNGYASSDTLAYGGSDAQTTTYTYTPDNLVVSTTDALSRTTAFTYDNEANLTQVTALSGTANAVSTSFTYEPTYNQLASLTDPLSHVTTFAHDSSGNISSVTDALSHATSFTYDAEGRMLSATDPLGNTTSFAYNQTDLISITDPLSRTVTRFLDSAGRLVAVANPLSQASRFAYDALNDVTSATDPQNNVTSFTYDGNGNLLSVTDANSDVTHYAYDTMDRLVQRTAALGNSESYVYDAAGNLSSFVDRRGKTTSYTYDDLNRRTFAGFGTTAGPSYESSITYNYDAGNRYTSVVDSVAGTITPTYDGLNRLTQEVSTQGTVSYGYDGASRRTSMTVTGQTAVDYTYDNANRLTQLTRGTPTVSLAYDNANRRTSVTLPNGVVMSYGYDSGSELTGITYTYSGSTMGNLSYSYDLAGRRVSEGGSYAQTGLPQPIGSASYNANNQLTQWGTTSLFYDANGNMGSDGTNSYAWNARNQLASMNFSSDSFQYDAYGRRTGRTISSATTNYLYDGSNVAQELSGTTPTAELLSGGIDEVFTRTDSSATANFLTDGLGSTIGLTDSSNTALASYAYEPFGNTTATSGSSANTYQYTGRENDGLGLDFNRARYYSPTLQRFISEDPIGFHGGQPSLYAYAKNDVLDLRDPMGLAGVGVTFGTSFFIGAGKGEGGSASFGGIYFPDTSSPTGFTSGGYITQGGFIGPNGGNWGNYDNNTTYGLSGSVGGGITLTNANSLSDIAGPFDNTTISVGPIQIDLARGSGGIGVINITAGLGGGIGITHYCTNTWTNPVSSQSISGRKDGCKGGPM